MLIRRRARAAAALQEMRAAASREPPAYVLEVVSIFHAARRGTKATVRMDGTERIFDAWFWWSRLKPGQTLLVSASSGFGPHTGRHGVLYVGTESGDRGIHRSLSPNQSKRARRHLSRTGGSS